VKQLSLEIVQTINARPLPFIQSANAIVEDIRLVFEDLAGVRSAKLDAPLGRRLVESGFGDLAV
jgi:hypothetical protein